MAIGTASTVCLYAQTTMHLVADLLGWYGTGGQKVTTQAPERVLDTLLEEIHLLADTTPARRVTLRLEQLVVQTAFATSEYGRVRALVGAGLYLIGMAAAGCAKVASMNIPAVRHLRLLAAPALLASASMNGAIMESTFNVFFKLNYQNFRKSLQQLKEKRRKRQQTTICRNPIYWTRNGTRRNR